MNRKFSVNSFDPSAPGQRQGLSVESSAVQCRISKGAIRGDIDDS
jgi:hypothetical protein